MKRTVQKRFNFTEEEQLLLERVKEGLQNRKERLLPDSKDIISTTQIDTIINSLRITEELLKQDGYIN